MGIYRAGRANLAAHWLFTLGFTCPYGVNVADFILDVASGAVTSSKLEADAAATYLVACSERCAILLTQADSICQYELNCWCFVTRPCVFMQLASECDDPLAACCLCSSLATPCRLVATVSRMYHFGCCNAGMLKLTQRKTDTGGLRRSRRRHWAQTSGQQPGYEHHNRRAQT